MDMSDDDIELMLEFKHGDYNAFATLVDRYQPALIHFFHHHQLDTQRAEDCAQEVWKRVFRARLNYEPKAQFKTFLFRVARNLWIDSFRSLSRHSREVSIDAVPREDGSLAAHDRGMAPASSAPGPFEALADRELKRSIEEALSLLPETHRDVFVLAEFEEMKYEEIAAILDVPVGTVKSRMFNAVRKLRELLRKEVS